MNKINQLVRNILLFLTIIGVSSAWQKMVHPPMPDYPKDTNPPGGPLKFYAAMDGWSVDSIRANFATDNNVNYVDGVSGTAVSFDKLKKGFVQYPGANDFGTQTNFSVSFWFNAGDISNKDHVNADGILAFGKTSDFWGNLTIYADHEASTADSMILNVVLGGNWIQYNGPTTRIANMYNNQWHHWVFTYDATSSTYTFYIDGQQYDQRNVTGVAFADASVLVIGGFEQAAGVQGTYADNSWMSPFPGAIDQVRLYGTVLSASDVTALYNSKL